MRRFDYRSSKGFTLIELSVVLVVIGLIIGSVLVGASILQNARVTATVNALQAIQSAVSTYNQNYNAMPGDDASAETRFSSQGVDSHGGGDGIIGQASLAKSFDNGTAADGNGIGESANVWEHLRGAGLVKGQGNQPNPPSNSFGGVIGIQNGAFSNGIASGTNVVCASGIPGNAARVIDQRLDDGSAISGIMRGGSGGVTADSTEYADGATYIVCMGL